MGDREVTEQLSNSVSPCVPLRVKFFCTEMNDGEISAGYIL